jgi:hypothetical protein
MSDFEELGTALDELRTFLEARGWSHCLVGGLAANRWGEVRYTQDVDLAVWADIGDENQVIDGLLKEFSIRRGRFKAKSEGRLFALQYRVLLLQSKAGAPIDVALASSGFEAEMLRRAKTVAISRGRKFRTASAEDIIVMKTLAGRAHDWKDIEGIIARQRDRLDWNYIHHWLDPLLELVDLTEHGLELEVLRQRVTPLPKQPPNTRKSQPEPSKKKATRKK